jgi:ribosome recycling factor
MPMDEIEFECESAMEKAVDYLKSELRGVRTGRASTGLVEHLKIDVPAYGATMELRELASLSVPQPTMILVKPFDPSVVKDIERGIRNSNIGISPVPEGKMLRLPIPPLSGERRQQIVAQIRKMAEGQRIAVRNARRDANKAIDAEQKQGVLTEDDAEKCKDNVQELTKQAEEKIESMLAAKTKELEEL